MNSSFNKICPHCREVIKTVDTRCKYCGGSVRTDAQKVVINFLAGLGIIFFLILLFFGFGGAGLFKFMPLLGFIFILTTGVIIASKKN